MTILKNLGAFNVLERVRQQQDTLQVEERFVEEEDTDEHENSQGAREQVISLEEFLLFFLLFRAHSE